MAIKGMSPEERLLKILRGGSNPNTVSDKKVTKESTGASYKVDRKEPAIRIIKIMNISLLAIFLASLAYLLFKLCRPSIYAERLTKLGTVEPIEIQGSTQDIKSQPFALEGAKREDLFIPSYTTAPDINEPLKSNIASSDFILRGIIAGENLQAIIEDKKDSKTYFLFKGDSVGDFRVKEILEGKVVLSPVAGQDIELRL